MVHRVVVVLMVMVTIAGVRARAAGVGPLPDGRSASDLAMEDFLLTAEIVVDEPLGQGITRPRKLTLVKNGVELHAIFKYIDEQGKGPTLNEQTHRIEADFSDSWKYEVATYRLDRALGFGLVPVTVARVIDGERGSVQEWIEDAETFRDLVGSGDTTIKGDGQLLMVRLTCMYILDQLIANVDRNYDNILVDADDDRFFLIDHSRSFRFRSSVDPPDLPQPVPLSERATTQLEALDREVIEEVVGDLLSKRQIRALAARRNNLLKVLSHEGLLPAA
jgi:hypothetical protein